MSIIEKAVGKQQTPLVPADESALPAQQQGEISDQSVPEPAIAVADFSDEALVAAGFRLDDKDVNWQLNKQFRRIKRPIVRFARDHSQLGSVHGNVIMVTSAVPSEGKTFCAANLGLVLALESDVDVILIDADVHRPKLSEAVGLRDAVGLLDYLGNPALQLADIIHGTGRGRLNFVPAGHAREELHELLASRRGQDLVDQLALDPSSRQDRIVLIDSPPLLPTTEAQVISGLVGMVVMVVDSQSTSPSAVIGALERINEEKAINYILNRAAESLLTGYQGGYYSYGYEAGAERKG